MRAKHQETKKFEFSSRARSTIHYSDPTLPNFVSRSVQIPRLKMNVSNCDNYQLDQSHVQLYVVCDLRSVIILCSSLCSLFAVVSISEIIWTNLLLCVDVPAPIFNQKKTHNYQEASLYVDGLLEVRQMTAFPIIYLSIGRVLPTGFRPSWLKFMHYLRFPVLQKWYAAGTKLYPLSLK